jgi:cardiolipin synthase
VVNFFDLNIVVAILAVLEIGGILLSFDAVMRPRSSQAAIAWSVSLISLPIVAIPLYLVFGRTRFEGYSEAIREKEALVEEASTSWYANMAEEAAESVADLVPLEKLVQGLTDVPFTAGNEVTLLVDCEHTYGEMLAAIAGAASYILVQFYIVKDGKVWQQLREALIDRARAGVNVYFLYDEIGSWQLSKTSLEELADEAIHVSGFKTTQGRHNRFQINFRNHRKLLVVDGHTGFIGGHNLADEYLTYRDTHIVIHGPAAQHIQLSFTKDWFWATRQLPDISTDVKRNSVGRSVAIVNTGPADNLANCSSLFATICQIAKWRLWLTSPYFVPDDVMVRALQAAAIRGVDVRLLLPGKADHLFVELASFTYYKKMIDCGVKFYRYQNRFLHQKVVLVDHDLAAVGTVNLDNRSLYLNFEATALVADRDFASQIEAMLHVDFEQSECVGRGHFDKKQLWFKIAARVARLTSPLL